MGDEELQLDGRNSVSRGTGMRMPAAFRNKVFCNAAVLRCMPRKRISQEEEEAKKKEEICFCF